MKNSQNCIKKTINFGKIAYANSRIKNNATSVTVELSRRNGFLELSICGAVWNSKHTDHISGGQNLDAMRKHLKHDKKFMEIHELWKTCHLNGMSAGTPEQDKILEQLPKYEYADACELLKKNNLYVVPWPKLPYFVYGMKPKSDGYTYGHGWIHKKLTKAQISKIWGLCCD